LHSYSCPITNALFPFALINFLFVSLANRDACAYGRYVGGDILGMIHMLQPPPVTALNDRWNTIPVRLGAEDNFSSGATTSQCAVSSLATTGTTTASTVTVTDSATTPAACYDQIHSFSQDRENNIYILSPDGVFELVSGDRCGFTCNADPVGVQTIGDGSNTNTGTSTGTGTGGGDDTTNTTGGTDDDTTNLSAGWKLSSQPMLLLMSVIAMAAVNLLSIV
jgi:hypothetical protein